VRSGFFIFFAAVVVQLELLAPVYKETGAGDDRDPVDHIGAPPGLEFQMAQEIPRDEKEVYEQRFYGFKKCGHFDVS
jgi:hypothetical protein